MAEFLTDKANFKCSGSPAVKFQVIEPTNQKVKYDGAPVLTDAAKIIGTGNCPLLAAKLGVPSAPCSCSLRGWIQFDVNKKIGSNFLLTKNSKNFCSVGGGNISVDSGGTGGKFSQGSKPVTVSAVSSANKNFDAQKEISVEKNSAVENKTSFQFYIGRNKKRKFKTVIDKNTKFEKWYEFIDAGNNFDILYSDLPEAISNEMDVTKAKRINVTLDKKDVALKVFIRAVKSDTIEYIVASSIENLINAENLPEPHTIKLE